MAYTKTNWQALPSTTTPINPTNLNHIEDGIKTNDDKLLGNTTMGNIKVTGLSINNNSLDYEIGTFTPNIRGETTAGTATYSIQEGQYEKIGKCLFYNFRIGCTLQNSAGMITIGGFPFTFGGKEASIGNVIVYNVPNGSSVDALRIYGQRFLLNTGGISALSDANWTSTGYIYGSGFIILQ